MKSIYYSKDIINGSIQEIPLGTKVIMKVEPIFKRKFIKGKLIKNDNNCIGIDYPQELGGTFLSREAIEYIKILEKGSNNMSKKEQLLNELEQIKKEFKEKIENIQNQIKEEDIKKECWTPRYGERYYIVDKLGKANVMISRSGIYDNIRIKNFNCFKTQEEAERVAFEQLLHRKLKKFAVENNEKDIDWNDSNQAKYYFFYLKGKFEYNYDYLGNRGLVYFTSKQVLDKAIEEFKDDLIRYFTSNK